MQSPNMEISDIIRASRKRKKLSQRKLAELLGVTYGAVGQWETGGGIRQEHMHALRIALDISEDFMAPASSPYQGEVVEDPDELALLRFWRGLDSAERRTFAKRLFLRGPIA